MSSGTLGRGRNYHPRGPDASTQGQTNSCLAAGDVPNGAPSSFQLGTPIKGVVPRGATDEEYGPGISLLANVGAVYLGLCFATPVPYEPPGHFIVPACLALTHQLRFDHNSDSSSE
jgi:hypothetical protein